MKVRKHVHRMARGTRMVSRMRSRVTRVMVCLALATGSLVVDSCSSDKITNTIDTPPTVTRVEVATPATTLSPPQTVQLTATSWAADGTVVPGVVSWSSSASAVATVNSSGLVTAVGAGTVTISAARQSGAGTVTLTVVPAGGTVTSISVSLSDVTLPIGALGQASVSARDANNAVIALGTRPLAWSSSNTAVATVSEAGVVAATGIGTSQIRASVLEGGNAVASTATLTVSANPDAVQSVDISMPGLTFSPADVVVKVNGTVRFIFPNLDHNVIWNPVTGRPADIGILSNQTVTRTFTTVGVFPYVCTLHDGMKGTIVVSP